MRAPGLSTRSFVTLRAGSGVNDETIGFYLCRSGVGFRRFDPGACRLCGRSVPGWLVQDLVGQRRRPVGRWLDRNRLWHARLAVRVGGARYRAFARRLPLGGCRTGPASQLLVAPPSTAMVWPVMKSLSAEARKTSVPNRSSGYSSRLSARRTMAGWRECSRWPGFSLITVSLSVKPGARLLTQILCSPSSRDSARANAVTAPFEVT